MSYVKKIKIELDTYDIASVYDGNGENISETYARKDDFHTGYNEVITLADLPIDKRLIVATIDSSQKLTLASTPESGKHFDVYITNTSDDAVTITFGNLSYSVGNTTKFVLHLDLAGEDTLSHGCEQCATAIDPMNVVGTVVFYDSQSDSKIFVDANDISLNEYPSDRYTPIGIVVIPASHDVYGTGQCGVMSLKEMNYTTPDDGSTGSSLVYWGQNNVNTSLPNFNYCATIGTTTSPTDEVSLTSSNSCLPSDDFSGTKCPTDPLAYYSSSISYYAAPSPYLEDGSRNPDYYYQIESLSSTLNRLADFDGVGNTEVLLDLATAQSNWRTDNTIKDSYGSGYSPAACCCWRFHTEGTKQGDWYLPACGELGYMTVRRKTINDVISRLINVYGSNIGATIDDTRIYLSSSESSSTSAACIGDCYVESCGKDGHRHAYAFLRL